MNRQHFHSFDALRFFSFLLVFLLHLPKTENPYLDFFLKSGGLGVMFFFVLSGFLITYILLHEKKHQGQIVLKSFFLRRILRIWPLFYAMIGFAYLTPYVLKQFNLSFSNQGYEPNLFLSLFFAENYKMMMTQNFPDGAPLRVMWSICIEEHFYLIWGILIFLIPINKTLRLITLSIVLANFTRFLYSCFEIEPLDLFSHLDYFAFGAIPAYLLLERGEYLAFLEKISLRWKRLFFVFVLGFIFILPNLELGFLKFLEPSFWGLMFALSLVFTLGKKNEIKLNDDWWFSKLGTYTYGLYLYHTIVILFFIQVFKYCSYSNWYLLAGLSLGLSIVLSVFSYHWFEKPFLKLKKYF